MIRGVFFLALLFTGFAPSLPAQASDPTAPVHTLYDALLASMKKGSSLDFSGRVAFLTPPISQAMDFPFMTRIAVGPAWREVPEAQRRLLVSAFADYSIGTYASEFNSYAQGDRFEVTPNPTPAGSDRIIHTRFIPSGGGPVILDYRVRQSNGQWRIIDIYLQGTISQLAARRSEYSSVLRQGGASALIDDLRKKTAELRGR